MLTLVNKNLSLFAVDENGKFEGQIVNDPTGRCIENPDIVPYFRRLFDGHGYIYEKGDHPFGVKNWAQIFTNPELLPSGTEAVFIDPCKNAEDSFNATNVSWVIN